ncbi:MAG: uroporphyrinogen-III C-methyltransferase [Elusimicrobia bacterium]|nr:uroporphyrinogen-III C-methyltransferase [Elusimicrobiota bacterium]
MKQKNYLENKVYIVGAGCGDCELITLKGLKILKKADCVIYDYLVNKKLLRYAPKTAELINADDTRNSFSDSFTKEQDKLNILIVEKSKKYKTVVRLKNGDPVIFGRLNEEVEILVKNKIDFEIVPGITAVSSAAASLNIGLTKTKFAPVVSFITGHENPFGRKSSVNYVLLPKQGTLVFYMATENLKKITKKLIEVGWNKNMFCAIVEKAGFPDEKKLIGRLKDVKKIVVGINSPTVFIVGDVLKYAIKC